MKIEYLGHSCFRIDDSLVIDPYKDGSVPGLEPLRVSGTRVICSHGHADHSGVECVEMVPAGDSESEGRGELTLGESEKMALGECGFEIEEVPSWHDDQQGKLRGPNTIFVITKDGEKLVHLGDLGHFPNDEQLAAISNADYLLIPVGGYYTIDASTAVRICLEVKPKRVIPMHYRTANSGYPELSSVDEFLKLCEEVGISDKVKVM